MHRRIVFIAGIHGVGKTWFCQQVANALALDHISASTLIRRARQQSTDDHKAVADVAQNQDVLIAALHRHQWQSPALLLDGHFCLLTLDNTIQAVPNSTFRQMNPALVILLHAPVSIIHQRLQVRDQRTLPLDDLTALQTAEMRHAQAVCVELSIPLQTMSSSDVAEACASIQQTILQKD